jgi:hypothetical protein
VEAAAVDAARAAAAQVAASTAAAAAALLKFERIEAGAYTRPFLDSR